MRMAFDMSKKILFTAKNLKHVAILHLIMRRVECSNIFVCEKPTGLDDKTQQKDIRQAKARGAEKNMYTRLAPTNYKWTEIIL